ncbi:hypothetical protein HPB52_021338 [Rhipicephalus sanguineus]|uniref:CCHC-type domain-containing protein n=1 Tax=Rhipicephalus sanguineus TaxID=34632 RepID=A0A9D4PDV0_RHISA|nr:hypothetical protein HPB52_021338 [Rhipicephalus sanguineus]
MKTPAKAAARRVRRQDTRSTRRAASRTDADGPVVGNEAGADGAAETGGQQPSPSETASSSRDPPMPLLETVRAWLQDFFAFVAPVRDALARTPPTAALPKLDVPTFTGHAAGASITDFLDDLSVYRASPTDDSLQPNRAAPSDRQRNPLNAGGPSRAAYRPQAPRGYREDMNQAGSCYRCGQRGHYRNECPMPPLTRRVSNQGNGHGPRW